jgi:predicted esterase YcpF (UPF0227 family)
LKTIVYLHGFISSPRSKKAVMLGDYLRNVASGVDYVVPEMHHRPSRAVADAAAACNSVPVADLTLVGSSLGGFYATVLAERMGCRARAHESLRCARTRISTSISARRRTCTRARSSRSRSSTSMN